MQLLLHHFKRQRSLIQLLFLTVLLPLALLYLVLGLQQVVPLHLLLRDANAEAYDHNMGILFFRGAFSNIGVLLWWAAAIVSAFTYFLLHIPSRAAPFTKRAKAFFLYMAVLTTLLALDDLFMFHEEVFPVRLGIPELAVYAVYGVLAAGLIYFLRFLVRTDFLVLILALGFLPFPY